jgi:hypothetical protein
VFVVLQKVRAGGAALTGGYHVLIGSVGVHDEDLIAIQLVARGLENEALAVGGPIGFGILATEGELLEILDVLRGLCERCDCAGE